MKLRSPSSHAPRGGRRRRAATSLALLWLALNALPTVLALGVWAAGGGNEAHAAGEDVWLEPRHLQHDDEDCARSPHCVFSSAGGQSLLGPPAELVVTRLDPRRASVHVHRSTCSPPCEARVEPHQPRAPPLSP